MFRKKPPVVAYTVERCGSCRGELRRRFRKGDCVFAESAGCTTCGGSYMVVRIFGEATE